MTYEVTLWPSRDIQVIKNVSSHQIPISVKQNIVLLLLVINRCWHAVPELWEGFPRWLCEALAPAVKLGTRTCAFWMPHLPLVETSSTPGMLSYCFYRERNKVICSEESGKTQVLNPSQLLFVWVLWAEMRREMRLCMSHLGIVGAAEESALVSRFIRKTNKGKYSLKWAKAPTQDQRTSSLNTSSPFPLTTRTNPTASSRSREFSWNGVQWQFPPLLSVLSPKWK